MRSCRYVGVLVILASVLAGCGNAAAPPPEFAHYVALGDSYTAAPGVDPALGTGDCGRSRSNYPALVARALRPQLTDVSCAGATVSDLLQGQKVTGRVLPAQVQALTAATDLVTVGIGGNDLDLVGLATACARQQPDCLTQVAHVQAVLQKLPGRIVGLVRTVRQRAPQARIVLVGYPTIISATAPCKTLPVPAAIVAPARELNKALVDAIKSAATTTKSGFVDLWKATADHGLCSKAPWIAGLDGKGAQPFHPTEDEQRAVASALEHLLARSAHQS